MLQGVKQNQPIGAWNGGRGGNLSSLSKAVMGAVNNGVKKLNSIVAKVISKEVKNAFEGQEFTNLINSEVKKQLTKSKEISLEYTQLQERYNKVEERLRELEADPIFNDSPKRVTNRAATESPVGKWIIK